MAWLGGWRGRKAAAAGLAAVAVGQLVSNGATVPDPKEWFPGRGRGPS